MKKTSDDRQYDSLQQFIRIKEIKKNVVVCKDGSLRAVLAVSSINFDLKSDKEQEAIIYSFQGFLNSLDFPLQILISSKKFNVEPYLKTLEKQRRMSDNELLNNQIVDYSNFIKELVGMASIMTKLFFVVVPFFPIESKKEGVWDKLYSSVNKKKEVYQSRELFESHRGQLLQRVGQIAEGLSGVRIKSSLLETKELIELFYNAYNPSEFEYVEVQNKVGKVELE